MVKKTPKKFDLQYGVPKTQEQAEAQAKYWLKTIPNDFGLIVKQVRGFKYSGWDWELYNKYFVLSLCRKIGGSSFSIEIREALNDSDELINSDYIRRWEGSGLYSDYKTPQECIQAVAKIWLKRCRDVQEAHREFGNTLSALVAQTKPSKGKGKP